MDPSTKLEAVFSAALQKSCAEERAAYLEVACGGDALLRQQVEKLLLAHQQAANFLEEPILGPLETCSFSPDSAPPPEGPGTRLGPYKLLQQIGEGGMGVVYMAEQHEHVRRLVALKIIRPGMDRHQVLARFEAERQALALMDHPNIAKVLDAGSTGAGRPYFVMELVKGTPITKFCDERRLPMRERLELFVSVCQAIQHAHQKGIIHRDIKPSNVLVALYDDKPVPKVIDFGVAKATGQALTEKTLNTDFGAVVGTPEYMSPEQATFNQLDIDTRSDVYALGVLLYELLTGTTPVDKARLKEAALLEVLRVVREEEPPRPSVKLSTAETRAAIAATRGTEPVALANLLRGELDWIALKALEKDRSRRYETAAGLGRDVERYLRDEVVEARPPSLGYRLRKTVRRNRGPALATFLVALSLLGGAVATTVGMMRAREAEKKTLAMNATIESNLMELKGLNEKTTLALAEAEKNERRAQSQKLRAETALHAIEMEKILRDWEKNDVALAYQALDKVPADFRETWEYRYLVDLCRRKAFPLKGRINSSKSYACVSPNGRTVAAHGMEEGSTPPQVVLVWDAATGLQKWTLRYSGDFNEPLTLLYHRKGELLAATRQVGYRKGQYQLMVWNVETGKEVLSIGPLGHEGLEEPVWYRALEEPNYAFSFDGKFLAAGHSEGVLIFDLTTGKQTNAIQTCCGVERVTFSDDGTSLLLGGKDLGVQIYSAESFEHKLSLAHPPGFNFHHLSFSPNGQMFLGILEDYSGKKAEGSILKVWDIRSGKEKFKVQPFKAWVRAKFAADSKAIVMRLAKEKLTALSTETGLEIPLPDSSGVQFEFLTVDGRRARVGYPGVLLFNPGETPFLKYRISTLPFDRPLGFDGQKAYLFNFQQETTFRGDQTETHMSSHVSITEVGSGKDPRILKLPVKNSHVPSVSPDGKRLFFDSSKFMDIASGTINATQIKTDANGGAFSPDGSRIAGRWRNALKVWDTGKGREELSLPLKYDLYGTPLDHPPLDRRVAFNSDGRLLATVDRDGTFFPVFVWSAETGELKARLESAEFDAGRIVRFFQDGRRLLIASRDRVRVWDFQAGKVELELWVAGLRGAVLSPDGTRVFAGPKIYDVATGLHVFTFPTQGAELTSLEISRDGQRLFVDGREGPAVAEAP